MAERLKAVVSKTTEGPALREFESRPFRHTQGIKPASVLSLQIKRKHEMMRGIINANGEMSELAEGARLEIVCAVTSGTEGSNPSLSAIKKCPKFEVPKVMASLCSVLFMNAGYFQHETQ